MSNENLTTDVILRLKYFMEQIGVSVTQFADNTGIQRSSMSQILGGRNQKISITTIGKIHDAYPDLSLSWLLSGEGDMLSNTSGNQPTPSHIETEQREKPVVMNESAQPFLSLFGNENEINATQRTEEEKYPKEIALKPVQKVTQQIEKEEVAPQKTTNVELQEAAQKNKRVVKIMIFYSDNTFEAFSPDSL